MNADVEALLRTLPRKIKVGAYDWRIKIENGESDDYGEMDVDTAQITVWPKNHQSPERLVGTVLHELLHVIYTNEEIDGAGGDREETVVASFETGLIALFRDNAKLLTWIKRGLKKSPDGRP